MSFKVSKSAFDSFVKFSEKITPSYPTSGSIIPVQAIISMFEECECLEVTLISFTLDSPPRPRLFKDGQRIEPDQFVSRGKATIIIGSWYTHILMNTHLAILFFMNNCVLAIMGITGEIQEGHQKGKKWLSLTPVKEYPETEEVISHLQWIMINNYDCPRSMQFRHLIK